MKSGLIIIMLILTLSVSKLAWLAIDKVQNKKYPEAILPSKESLEAIVISTASEQVSDKKSEMVARPLFWKERRPYVAKAKKVDLRKSIIVEEGDDPFDKVKLIGVYSGGAIVVVAGEKQRLHIGDEVAEWTLDLMNADSVIFVQGSESKLLQLEHATVKPVKVKTAKFRTEAVTKPDKKANSALLQRESQQQRTVPKLEKKERKFSPTAAELHEKYLLNSELKKEIP